MNEPAPTSGPTVTLIGDTGRPVEHVLRDPVDFDRHPQPFESRTVYAAPHTVADALADYTPGVRPPVDWDATIAFRRHLWSYGIGVAEAMDTSERGPGGLVWEQAQELITRSLEAASEVSGAIVCGAGTDQLDDPAPSLDQVADAYQEQVDFIEAHGGSTVIRASHALVGAAETADDYLKVYDRVLSRADRPAIVHWLGAVFDPSLTGYWGSVDLDETQRAVVELAHRHPTKLAGIKFSLLDAEREVRLRSELPEGVAVFTGDDYDYPTLLRGDGASHSHGLLGVLDPLAPVASRAFAALDEGDGDRFEELMGATVPLAVRMFEEPAAMYKTGCVFIAYLSGHQDHFRMISGREGMRSAAHLSDLFRLTDALGLFPDPHLAAHRMRLLMEASGVG